MMMFSGRGPFVVGLVAVTLAAAACSSSSSTSTAGKSPSATASPAVSSTASPSASAAAQITVTGKNTDLTLDASTAQALKNAGVQVSPVAPAAATSSGGISFPITGGTLTQAGLQGQITHGGGLKFTHSGKTVTATDLVLSTTQGILSATVDGRHVSLLAVSLAAMARTTSGSEIVAGGITSTITTSAAVLLDARLVVRVFTKGLPVGTLTTYITGKTS